MARFNGDLTRNGDESLYHNNKELEFILITLWALTLSSRNL